MEENFIECLTMSGEKKMIPREKIRERTAAYAFIFRGRDLLFVNTKTTGKKWIPGGEVEAGETHEEALRREVREETGIEISAIHEPIHQKEILFFYEPWDEGYDNQSFFYICDARSEEFISDSDLLPDEETCGAHWYPIDQVRCEDLQPCLDEVFPLVKEKIFEYLETKTNG
jgi:8-oxo-dGTP pyrophosphatase MutT (NUDIX family)